MDKEYDVCCAGHICTDILIRPLDNLPERGTLGLVDSMHQKSGGCAMNTSIGLAKLGIRVAMLGAVGQDGFGDFIRNTLTSQGVDIQGLRIKKGGMTSASVVAIGSDGERTIIHCLGTNKTLRFDDIDLEAVKKSRVLFIGGTFLLPAFDGADAARLLAFARENGVLTVMDTAWDASNRWLETIKPSLRYLDWFLPSVEEAEQMAGTRDPEKLAAVFRSMGVRNIAIKMGKEGCYVNADSGDAFYLPIYDANRVDTSGAGDAWCAGFLAGLAKGRDVRLSAKMGNACGALCVTKIGTTEGLKGYKDTMKFIEIHEVLGR